MLVPDLLDLTSSSDLPDLVLALDLLDVVLELVLLDVVPVPDLLDVVLAVVPSSKVIVSPSGNPYASAHDLFSESSSSDSMNGLSSFPPCRRSKNTDVAISTPSSLLPSKIKLD